MMRRLALALIVVLAPALHGDEPRTIRIAVTPSAERKGAPDFNLLDASGKSRKLADYRGKVLLLDFWATECGGCKLEIPWFIDIAQEYRKRDLAVVGVSMDILYEDLKSADEAWTRVTPFVKKTKINYPIVMGDGPVGTAYSIQALPQTWLIDRNGRVAATYIGLVNAENLRANLKALLAE
jgi:peroxiredoxin